MNDKPVLRVGIGGPVGSGKTALVDALCKHMRDEFQIAVCLQRHLHPRRPAVFNLHPSATGRADYGGLKRVVARIPPSVKMPP